MLSACGVQPRIISILCESSDLSALDRFRRDGKTAIVTGGNGWVGYAILQGFAAVGANVVITNRDAQSGQQAATELTEETGVDRRAVPTEVADPDDVQDLSDAV